MALFQTRSDKYAWLLLLAFVLLVFLGLGSAPVYILDEAKNAQCAREMGQRGDWVVPTFNGALRTDKPALHYWFMMIAYKLFGVGEWQARFFSALCGVGTLLISYLFVRRFAHPRLALFTVFVLSLSAHFAFEFRLAVPDPYLIFFSTLGLFAGYAYLEERKAQWLLMAAAALAFATLAKGPVALLLPGLCLLTHSLWFKKWWLFSDPRLLLGLLVYAAIALPWFYAVHKATDGAFTRGFFFDHNLNRFSGELEGHGGFFFLPVAFVVVGLLPTSLLVWLALRKQIQMGGPLFGFGVVVSCVFLVFFGFSSTKLPNYPMPCYPFAAVVLAWVLDDCWRRRQRLPFYASVIWTLFALAIPVGAYLALKAEPGTRGLEWLAFGCAVLLPFVVATLTKRGSNLPIQLRLLALGYFLFNAYVLAWAYPRVYLRNPISATAPIWKKEGVRLVAYKSFNPAFLFNMSASTAQIPMANDTAALQACIREWSAKADVLVVTRLDKMEELKGLHLVELARERDLFELPTTVILKPIQRK
jgi:4-amino-4-deoxy-L-arabinose transferase-like glycosyltransferase